MFLWHSSVTIRNRFWIEVIVCYTEAFNMRLGEEIALKRGAPIFGNRSANRTTEIQRRIVLVHFRLLAPFSKNRWPIQNILRLSNEFAGHCRKKTIHSGGKEYSFANRKARWKIRLPQV